MSHTSRIFEQAKTRVPNRNGFDLSHLRSGSSKTGQLVPCMCKLLPPASKFSLGVAAEVSLPPLAANFFGRVDFIIEGFVCPLSILYGGWKQFISNNEITQYTASQRSLQENGGFQLPVLDTASVLGWDVPRNWTVEYSKHNNLFEFLGFKGNASEYQSLQLSLLPALCYHRIVDVFYRNSKITRTWFGVNPNRFQSDYNHRNISLVWHSFYTKNTRVFTSEDELTFPDGVYIYETRQRPWSRDYFTSAVPDLQQGDPSKVSTVMSDPSTGDDEDAFTISAFRFAVALQRFRETNNLSGSYEDMIYNRWGSRPIDADFDEPYYLGRLVIPVYQKTVYQSNGAPSPSIQQGNNPFRDILGSNGASGSFSGSGSITKSFNVSCWSYVMCIASLVPHATYSSGINKELLMTSLGDFPSPEFQSVGYEAIKNYEVYFDENDTEGINMEDFGYIPRYSFFKYMNDEVVGELAPVQSLGAFQLQRIFAATPELSTDFVTIPQNALDNVMAVSTANMNLTCWYEIFFEFKVSMPLTDFVLPTLSDMQDTHVINTTVGGSKL